MEAVESEDRVPSKIWSKQDLLGERWGRGTSERSKRRKVSQSASSCFFEHPENSAMEDLQVGYSE